MADTTPTTTLWEPGCHLQVHGTHAQHTIILLNQPIVNKEFFLMLWKYASLRICADGGANRLYDGLTEAERSLPEHMPQSICGDLDSIRPEVKEFYKTNGVIIIQDPRQDSTDFGKCINHIKTTTGGNHATNPILVYNALAGRVDHAFHTIHLLYTVDDDTPEIFVVSEEGITFLLNKGLNKLKLPHEIFGLASGIIPVGGRSVITTKGLMYDVKDWETSFVTQVSTSNYLEAEEVEIETTERVIYTVQIKVEGILHLKNESSKK